MRIKKNYLESYLISNSNRSSMFQISDTLIKNSIPKLINSGIESYELFMDNNQDVNDVASIRNLHRNTVINHLLPFIAANIDKDSILIEKLIDSNRCYIVWHYLSSHPHCELKKEIFSALNEEISYCDICLSIAVYIRYNADIDKSFIRNRYYHLLNNPIIDRNQQYSARHKKDVDYGFFDYDDDEDDYRSWSYEDSLAEACDGDYYAMLELEDRG